jgi:hypothetical protein
MPANLLAPVFALVLWTLIMLFWLMFRRFPAIAKAKIDISQNVGGRGQDLDRILPARVNWVAHNYAHLMEQPTIFYATVLGLAVLGQASLTNIVLAWTYVGLRVVHSLWQVLVNRIPIRGMIFLVSTLVLIALAVNGMIAVLSA